MNENPYQNDYSAGQNGQPVSPAQAAASGAPNTGYPGTQVSQPTTGCPIPQPPLPNYTASAASYENSVGPSKQNLFDDPPKAKTPYIGGIPVRCPKCSNVVNTRICPYCALDLSTVYTVSQPAVPYQQPQSPYSPPYPSQPYYPAAPYVGTQYQPVPAPPSTIPMQPPMGTIPANPAPPQQGYTAPPIQPQVSPNGGGYVPPENAFPQQPLPYPGGISPQLNSVIVKKSHRTTWIICGISLFFILIFTLSFILFRGMFDRYNAPDNGIDIGGGSGNTPSSEEYYYPGGVNLKEYKEIKKGMTYARVSKIIGGDGSLIETGETIDGDTYYVYGWIGEENPNVEVYITFTDDIVTEITNKGLTASQ